jgi:hypothetical protein
LGATTALESSADPTVATSTFMLALIRTPFRRAGSAELGELRFRDLNPEGPYVR